MLRFRKIRKSILAPLKKHNKFNENIDPGYARVCMKYELRREVAFNINSVERGQ
jgi:hypothetical protein